MRIIQIFTDSISNIIPQYKIQDDPGSLPYEGGWHVKFSKQLLRFSGDYEVECWGVEKGIGRRVCFVRDGIVYKVFPSFYLNYFGEVSLPLLFELRDAVRSGDVIVHVHGIYNYTTFLVPFFVGGVPLVLQHHGDRSGLEASFDYRGVDPVKRLGYSLLYVLKLEWLFERVSLRRFDRIFLLNDSAIRYITRFIDPGRVEKLTMGIDFSHFHKMDRGEARKQLGLDQNKKYVLAISAFVKRKGLDYLLRAFPDVLRAFPDTELILIGEGNHREDLEKIVRDLGITNSTKFYSRVKYDLLPLFYNASDVCILSSLNEGLGLVSVEALACGTPFIGTDVGGIPEVVRNFSGGVIVPPRNEVALSDAIIGILGNGDPGFSVDRGEGMKFYDWENIVKRTIHTYEEIR